jgi:hypothetical protein
MASVAITGPVLEAVTNKVRELERAEHVEIERKYMGKLPPSESADPALVELITAMHWDEHRHYMYELPPEWLLHQERAQLNVTTACSRVEKIQVEGDIMRVPNPERYAAHALLTVDVDVSDLPEGLQQQMAAKDEHFSALSDLKAKYDSIVTQLRNFLNSHKTLNQALKDYPDLVFFLDKKLKDRLERVGERPAPVASSTPMVLDKELITSTAVLAQLKAGA